LSTAVESRGHLISGEEVPAASGETFDSLDPATGEPIAAVARGGAEDVDRAVRAARAALSAWRGVDPYERGRILQRLANLIEEHGDELTALEARDAGKLAGEAARDVDRAVRTWTYYAGWPTKITGTTNPADPGVFSYTLREPLGVVGVITPWNSPVLLTMMGAAPALAAGNAIVIKPSEFTSASILEVMKLVEAAGFPPGILNVVTGGRATGEALVAHPRLSKITFTGGTETGRVIARLAGERLSRCTLELGGKSANIVFADANLDAAEAGVLAGIYGAAGQTCIAGSRALIERPIFDELVGRLVRRADAIVLGDPMDPATQMGPVATETQLAKIESSVHHAREGGAEVFAGGERAFVPDFPSGLFYKPTIIGRVTNDARAAQEEIFGPVLTVIPFEGEEQAVRLANATRYGLAAGIWTQNLNRAHGVAGDLEAGTVWINLYRAITYSSPFGGYKDSGVGRENGQEAVNEYLQTKSVWIELGDEIQDPFVLRV
jgi:aldehyde dehydrogenase (NAD+)